MNDDGSGSAHFIILVECWMQKYVENGKNIVHSTQCVSCKHVIINYHSIPFILSFLHSIVLRAHDSLSACLFVCSLFYPIHVDCALRRYCHFEINRRQRGKKKTLRWETFFITWHRQIYTEKQQQHEQWLGEQLKAFNPFESSFTWKCSSKKFPSINRVHTRHSVRCIFHF